MFRLTSWSSNQDEISSVIGSPAKIFSLGKWSGLCVQGYFWGHRATATPIMFVLGRTQPREMCWAWSPLVGVEHRVAKPQAQSSWPTRRCGFITTTSPTLLMPVVVQQFSHSFSSILCLRSRRRRLRLESFALDLRHLAHIHHSKPSLPPRNPKLTRLLSHPATRSPAFHP